MSSGPENRFIQAIHRLLPARVYRMKNHNPYVGGVADCWYSGTAGDLWVEYKLLELPKKPTTIVDLCGGSSPALSALQQEWLRNRHHEGRSVGVIIGTYTGNECNYGTVLATGNGAIPAATIATLKPGDLVFATWSGHNPTWDHVGMFIGKGTYGANGWMDHGGNPNYGPVQRNLATYSSNFSEWQINRCV